MWKEKLRKLITNGHLRRIPEGEWSDLTEDDCKRLCGKALQNPPLTFMAATLKQKNLIRNHIL